MVAHDDRILLIYGESKYGPCIQHALESEGYDVLTSRTASVVAESVVCSGPDLVVLICDSGIDARNASRHVRVLASTPIIVLVENSELPTDRVKALDGGADDCISVPFVMDEFLARVRAIMRRVELSAATVSAPTLRVGELRIDFDERRVFNDGREVHLSATEFRLLCLLARHRGQILEQDYLLENVWGLGYAGTPNLLWTAMHRLRRKIEPTPDDPQLIQTRPGLGYMLAASN